MSRPCVIRFSGESADVACIPRIIEFSTVFGNGIAGPLGRDSTSGRRQCLACASTGTLLPVFGLPVESVEEAFPENRVDGSPIPRTVVVCAMSYELLAILLLVVGCGLIVAEIFIPSGGMILVLCVLSFISAIWCAYKGFWVESESPALFWSYIGAMVVLIPTVVIGMFRVLANSRVGDRILLVAPELSEVTPHQEEQERLSALEQIHDGFELAEVDLELRGPGDFFGTRQSGLPNLRMAHLSDRRMLEVAREEAAKLREGDPELTAPEHAGVAAQVERLLGRVSAEAT